MNEILRKELWRKLEALPDEKAYQVLDYVTFLESEYGQAGGGEAGAFQRFSELFQRTLRRQNVPASALRETMRVLGAADRVFDAFREAGKEFLGELEGGRPEPSAPTPAEKEPPRSREIKVE